MIEQNLRELLEDRVKLDVEGIDRLYLNAYQPRLQTGGGVVAFFKGHRGATVASTTLMAPMSQAFVAAIHRFAKHHGIETVHFRKGERKDEVTRQRLKQFEADEGVLYLEVAQEKFSTFRVTKKRNPTSGTSFPWLHRSAVMCNQYYFYRVDEDFGPLSIKFSGYFPYTRRLRLHGIIERISGTHRYQLTPQGIRTCLFLSGEAWPDLRRTDPRTRISGVQAPSQLSNVRVYVVCCKENEKWVVKRVFSAGAGSASA